MSDRRSFSVQALSLATPEQVFAVLADVPRWQEWAGPVVPHSSYEREGVPAPGGVGAIRRLGSGPLSSREEIVTYEPPHRLAYVLLNGQSRHGYRAQVDLERLDAGGTRITWSGSFRPPVPGTGPLMLLVFKRLLSGFAHRLASRAEQSPTVA
jgi:uncharacterized protein YndB with AHSA1/START domain